MNILFFAYSWWSEFKLDPYQQSILDTLVTRGHRVHVVIGNRYAVRDGVFGFSGCPLEFAKYIRENDIRLVLCKNNAGNFSEIRNRVNVPFVSWASDEFSHIFRPDGDGPEGMAKFFGERMDFLTTSSNCDKFYRRAFPEYADRIHFVAHCTSPEKFRRKKLPQSIDVSFIGSSLDMNYVYRLLMEYARTDDKSGAIYRAILEAIESLRRDYHHDFDLTLDRLQLRPVLEKHNLTPSRFKMLCTNVTSNNERFQLLAALENFETAIFGNQSWIDSLNYTTALCREYRPWHPVRNFDDLVEVYQSSKISISIPQHQVGASIQYRVIDIMASDALLLTKYSEDSDLLRIFGPECPVPMYRSPEHLRQLCEHYLTHESERLALVERCQQLVATEFSFEYRLRKIFEMVSLPFDTAGPGAVIKPDFERFFTLKIRIIRTLKSIAQFIPFPVRHRLRAVLRSIGMK